MALQTFDLWSGMLSYHRSIALHQHANQKLHAAISAVEQSCNATCSCRPPPCSCTSGNCTKAELKAAATTTCLPLLENVSRVYEQHLTTLLAGVRQERSRSYHRQNRGSRAQAWGPPPQPSSDQTTWASGICAQALSLIHI